MRTLTKEEYKVFESIAKMTQKELHKNLYKVLKKHYKKVTYDKSFLIAQGNIPIALIAHMDTVFKVPPKEILYDRQKNIMISPQGLGADDRAGIFAILKIITDGFRPHIIFTTDEEIGCVGSNELSYRPFPFNDLRYMIQLDRRNSNDCVFYECDNDEFEKYVEKFGFVTAYGSFTDICELAPVWKIAGVNLSIGYRDEHSPSEVLFVGQMFDTIRKVENMLNEKNIPTFEYIPAYPTYSRYYYGGWGYPGEDDEFDESFYKDVYSSTRIKCKCCEKFFTYEDMLPVKLIKGGIGYYCINCLDKVEWCRECGEAFEIDPAHPKEQICSTCRKRGLKEHGIL